MKQYNGEKVIVALTSFGKRFEDACKTIFSIVRGTFQSVHIVLTIYDKDIKDIPHNLQTLIDANVIEVLPVSLNLRSHLKYFYVMQKYRNVPIITVDDDMCYYPKTVEDLYNAYKKYNCVIARKCRKMTFENGKINPFNKWIWDCREEAPSNKLHALGFSGVIYPPDCLKLSTKNIDEIKEHCLRADDIYLNVLEIRNGVKVKCLHKNYGKLTNMYEKKGDKSLSLDDDNMKVTNSYINHFAKEFNKCR